MGPTLTVHPVDKSYQENEGFFKSSAECLVILSLLCKNDSLPKMEEKVEFGKQNFSKWKKSRKCVSTLLL